MPLIYTLFLIVFLEGYVVLSLELLAIRQLIPFIGAGTDTTAILISAVLVPLAFGYYTGGHFKSHKKRLTKAVIRKRLLLNFSLAAVMLVAALTYTFIIRYADIAEAIGLDGPRGFAAFYGMFLIAPPVYLLGQTIPLISNYMPKQTLSRIAGKILFFSTSGSFAGAVLTTVVFMSYIGVHYTISITAACLLGLTIIVAKRWLSLPVIVSALALLVSLVFNGTLFEMLYGVVENNQHNMVWVMEEEVDGRKTRFMNVTQPLSSSLALDEETGEERSVYEYIRYVEDNFISNDRSKPKQDILIVGAGGFSVGNNDEYNNYIFVDIDEQLKETAEKYFLKKELSPNKTFIAEPIRRFLAKTDKKFDLVFLDITRGPVWTPDHLVTKEFYEQVKNVLKPNGIVTMNQIVGANFADVNSVVLDNTIRAVFPNVLRQSMNPFKPWRMQYTAQNIMYTYFNHAPQTTRIYTDDLNRQALDKRIIPNTGK